MEENFVFFLFFLLVFRITPQCLLSYLQYSHCHRLSNRGNKSTHFPYFLLGFPVIQSGHFQSSLPQAIFSLFCFRIIANPEASARASQTPLPGVNTSPNDVRLTSAQTLTHISAKFLSSLFWPAFPIVLRALNSITRSVLEEIQSILRS